MRLKGHLLVVVCFVFVLGGCGQTSDHANDDKWDKIKEGGELVVGTPGTLYPSSYYPEDSDELTGYDVEVMKEVGNRLDLNVQFEELGFDEMFAALQSGRIDVAPAGVRGETKKKFSYSKPYKYSYATMVVREDAVDDFTSLEDLDGKIAGGAATTVYSDIARRFDAEVKTYGNVTNDVYLRDVENGRTDVVINDYYLQLLALKALPDLDVTIQPDLKFYQSNQHAVIEKNADRLKEKINETLADMKQDGTLTELSEEFFAGEDVSEKPEENIRTIEGID